MADRRAFEPMVFYWPAASGRADARTFQGSGEGLRRAITFEKHWFDLVRRAGARCFAMEATMKQFCLGVGVAIDVPGIRTRRRSADWDVEAQR